MIRFQTPKLLSRTFAPLQAALLTALLAVSAFPPTMARAASCQNPTPSYGSVSSTVTLPATATYRVWSRIMAADATNNTYYLNIDNANCFNVGGAGVSATGWSWVDYQDGTANSKVELALNQGSHSLTFIGNKPNVKLDHVIFTSDLACIPTGNGDNCNTPTDTTPPTVHITAPTDGSTLSGTAHITVNASDTVGVSRVELYANSILKATATSAPYAFDLDTTKLSNGQQILTAKAWDAAGNFGTESVSVTVQNNDTQAPTKPMNFSAKATGYNKVNLSWTASTDNVGIKGYRLLRNNVQLVDLTNVTAYEDNTVLPNTQYTYQIMAIDTSTNYSAAASATVTTPKVTDTQAPTAPTQLTAVTASSSQINLSWQAATDNIGVANYDVFRARGSGTARKVATVTTLSYGDTGLNPNTAYTYYVVAKDAAGNKSPASTSASATTAVRQRAGVIQGTVRDETTNKPIAGATVSVSGQGQQDTYRTDSSGTYAIRRLGASRYTVTYRARGHQSRTISVQVDRNSVVTRNVTLTEK